MRFSEKCQYLDHRVLIVFGIEVGEGGEEILLSRGLYHDKKSGHVVIVKLPFAASL